MQINPNKNINEFKVETLINQGYKDLGWINSGKAFPEGVQHEEELDLSMYSRRGTHICYINHTHKLILRVDMSD